MGDRGYTVYRDSDAYDFKATKIEFTGVKEAVGSGYFIVPDLYNDFTNGAGINFHDMQETEIYIEDKNNYVRFRGIIINVYAITSGIRFDIVTSTFLLTQRHCKAEYPFDKGSLTDADATYLRLQDSTKNWTPKQWNNHGVLSYPSTQFITPYKFVTHNNLRTINGSTSGTVYMGRGWGTKDDGTGTYTTPANQFCEQSHPLYFALVPHDVSAQLAVLSSEPTSASENDCLRMKWTGGDYGNKQALVDVLFDVGEVPTSDMLGINIKIQAALRSLTTSDVHIYIWDENTDGAGVWEDLCDIIHTNDPIDTVDDELVGIFQVWDNIFELSGAGGDFIPLNYNSWSNYVFTYKYIDPWTTEELTKKCIRICVATTADDTAVPKGMQVGYMAVQLIREGTDTNQYKITGTTAPASIFFAADPTPYIGEGDKYAICPSLMTVINDMVDSEYGAADYPFSFYPNGIVGAADHFISQNFLDQKHLTELNSICEYKNLTWWFDPSAGTNGIVYIDEEIDLASSTVHLTAESFSPDSAVLSFPQTNILGRVIVRGNKSVGLEYDVSSVTGNSTQEIIVSRPWISNYQEIKTYGDSLLAKWEDILPSFKVTLDNESITNEHLLRPGKTVQVTYKNLSGVNIPINRFQITWEEGKKPTMVLEAGRMGTPPWEKTEDHINRIWSRVRQIESGAIIEDYSDNLYRQLKIATRGAGSTSWVYSDPIPGSSGIIGLIDSDQNFILREPRIYNPDAGDPIILSTEGTGGNEVIRLDKGGLIIPEDLIVTDVTASGNVGGTWTGDVLLNAKIPTTLTGKTLTTATFGDNPSFTVDFDLGTKNFSTTGTVTSTDLNVDGITFVKDGTNLVIGNASSVNVGGGASIYPDALSFTEGVATWVLEVVSEDTQYSVTTVTAGDRAWNIFHNNTPTKVVNMNLDGALDADGGLSANGVNVQLSTSSSNLNMNTYDIYGIGELRFGDAVSYIKLSSATDKILYVQNTGVGHLDLHVHGDLRVLDTVIFDTVINAAIDTDKFLVLDSANNVDFRTGDNVLSDIGGASSADLAAHLIDYANPHAVVFTDINTATATLDMDIFSIRVDVSGEFIISGAELSYLDGVSSNIQTQFNDHFADTSTHGVSQVADNADLHAQSHDNTYHTTNYKPIADAPLAHHISHEDAGADELDLAGMSGLLATQQTPIAHTNTYHSTNYATESALASLIAGTTDFTGETQHQAGVNIDATYALTWGDLTDYGIFSDSGLIDIRIAARGSVIINIDSNNNDTSSGFGVVNNENDFTPAAYIMRCDDSGFRLSNAAYVTTISQVMGTPTHAQLLSALAVKTYVDAVGFKPASGDRILVNRIGTGHMTSTAGGNYTETATTWTLHGNLWALGVSSSWYANLNVPAVSGWTVKFTYTASVPYQISNIIYVAMYNRTHSSIVTGSTITLNTGQTSAGYGLAITGESGYITTGDTNLDIVNNDGYQFYSYNSAASKTVHVSNIYVNVYLVKD